MILNWTRRLIDTCSAHLLRGLMWQQWQEIVTSENNEAFDAIHNTRTGEVNFWDNYVPTPVSTFEQILADLPKNARQCTFIDVGSGCGRVVLLASKVFSRAVGVEISARYHEQALQNRAQFIKQTGTDRAPEFIHADIQDYLQRGHLQRAQLETGLVLFLYAPFSHTVLQRMLTILFEHHPWQGKLYLIFVNPLPHYSRVIESFDPFRCIAHHNVNGLLLSFFRAYRIYEAK